MVDERSRRRLSGSKSARKELYGSSTGQAEPEQASRSRSDPESSSYDLTYDSELASRQDTRDGGNVLGSSVVNLQSLGPSAIRSELEGLFEELRPETLAGPVLLIDQPSKLGEGGQFYVYRQEVGFLDRKICHGSFVAVKRPKIASTDPSPDAPIDLADPKVQQSLRHVRNEIKALTHAGLQGHPNIVTLLSWAFGEEWDRPFVLVLELAREDLARALGRGNGAPPDPMKVKFCSDIANGLEAIHEAHFVHGDLKPANVLIFREETGFVAKLADFGYSADESTDAVGGTPGWNPPEVRASRLGDCFSYGLLVWSILFLGGETPPYPTSQSRKELALAHVKAHRGRYPRLVTERISTALSGLLEEGLAQRSCRVNDFFVYATKPDHGGHQNAMKNKDPHVLYNFIPISYAWEIRPRSAALLGSLYRRSEQSSRVLQLITPEVALALGLYFSAKAPPETAESWQIARKFLETSADQGNFVASGIASRFCRMFCNLTNSERTTKWLALAADMGSVHAGADLRKLDLCQSERSRQTFRSLGGYNMFYWSTEHSPGAPALPVTPADETTLHGLAAFGSCKELEDYIDNHGDIPINALSERGETALYGACARGSWEHAKLLLERGADPSIKCTVFEITCLHWIFAFDNETCEVALQAMLKKGADIDALIPANMERPFPHYPFVLPAGTPLHWAVTTSSHDAIRALIEAGASSVARNGSDPYMYDDRIRHLYAVGGPDAEGCTLVEPGCLGLSAVDLAVVHRDPFLLQLMAERKDCVDMNFADEEGFTVLHRLATSQIFRTSRRVRYSALTFRELDETKSLRALIVAILSLGGDIEKLTSDADTAIQKRQRDTDLDKSSYTPLMLAMLEADHCLVEALLECGANANTENASKTTALFHISHRANHEQPQLLQCIQMLCAYGANVNHRSSTGNTPLLAAAQGRILALFDLLLSQGAHIDERDRTDRTVVPGKSVFASFASTDSSSDGIVLELLTKYVFGSSESEKKGVIQDGSDSGSTLLHECAGFAMPNCVKALLQNGARVNALARKHPGGTLYETPLDRLKSTKDFKMKMYLERKTLSTEQWVVLETRWNEAEEHLKGEGGKFWTPDMAGE